MAWHSSVEDGALIERERMAMAAARGRRVRPKPVRVVARPFAGLRAVLYDRGDHFEVRWSDLLRDAPEPVRASLARILMGNLDRRLRATREERADYLAWSRSAEVAAADERLRRARGRKRMRPPQGAHHDLETLFHRLNREYFGGALPTPRLGWTLRASRSLYGHQDPAHDAIVLNRRLDHPRVPESVVADILHHEMLHLKHGVGRGASGRRIVHSTSFRRDERSFPLHEEARGWLRQLESGRLRLRPVRTTPQRSLFSFARDLFRAANP